MRIDLYAECRGERRGDQFDVADRDEIDEERTEPVVPGRAGSELDGEAGLADPADTRQRHQPLSQTHRFQRGELESAANDRAHRGRQVRRTQGRQAPDASQQSGVMSEDRLLDLANAGPGSIPSSAASSTRARP